MKEHKEEEQPIQLGGVTTPARYETAILKTVLTSARPPHTCFLVVQKFRNYSYGLGIVVMMDNPDFLVNPSKT